MSYKEFSKAQDALRKDAAGDKSKDAPAADPQPPKADETTAKVKPTSS